MIKRVTVGHMHVILSAARENPVYKKEREVMRMKFLRSTPHRLRMTLGFRSILKIPSHRRLVHRWAMAA